MSLASRLKDEKQILFLYSTTPPRATTPEDRIQNAVERLVERASRLEVDGVVVYDVQDEHERTTEERPFPFLPILGSMDYAKRLVGTLDSPVITYKCISGMDETRWSSWLDDAAQTGLSFVSVVGHASSKARSTGISMPAALEIASHHPGNVTLGGVVIPERHRPDRSESARLIGKAQLGCEYFISQAVYDADAAIRLLRDYATDCKAHEVAPKRLFFTITPCGFEKTITFMKWLGIRILDETVRRILDSPEPIAESIRICVENFRRIAEVAEGLSIPIGVNVESISIRKDEIAGSIDLYGKLSASYRA